MEKPAAYSDPKIWHPLQNLETTPTSEELHVGNLSERLNHRHLFSEVKLSVVRKMAVLILYLFTTN